MFVQSSCATVDNIEKNIKPMPQHAGLFAGCLVCSGSYYLFYRDPVITKGQRDWLIVALEKTLLELCGTEAQIDGR